MPSEPESVGPIHLAGAPENRALRFLWPVLRPALNRILCISTLNAVRSTAANQRTEPTFFDRVLATLDVRVEASLAPGAQIPPTGPLIVVANHPLGGIEGMVLPALLHKVRHDIRILGNFLLNWVPEMREWVLPVDPFGSAAATRANYASMRRAVRWVADGGALIVFPAGEVSHLSLRELRVVDPPWSPSIAGLARRTGARVLPAYFSGQNGPVFQLAGLIHPRLRTLLLPRELLRRRPRSVTVHLGTPIEPKRIARFRDDQTRIDYLRLRTDLLAFRTPEFAQRTPIPPDVEPIRAPVDPALLESDIRALPPDATLVRRDGFVVFLAPADRLPAVLPEIGRLREATFRPVGEGTGRCHDLDDFDQTYRHLFLWDSTKRKVAGAYRIGATDEILPRFGPAGLYTHSLFRFRGKLLRQLGPALELGRSFVMADYQREFAPLLLLWRGIGAFVCRNPRYRMLFGAVSISDRYLSVTRQLLMAFVEANFGDRQLARLLRPVNPPQLPRIRPSDRARLARVVGDLRDIDDLVGELETSMRGMPVLLRQYLKLNARLLGFNVDPAFSNALDGLMLVDLTAVDRPVLDRYLGDENAARFLAYHGSGGPPLPGGTSPTRTATHD